MDLLPVNSHPSTDSPTLFHNNNNSIPRILMQHLQSSPSPRPAPLSRTQPYLPEIVLQILPHPPLAVIPVHEHEIDGAVAEEMRDILREVLEDRETGGWWCCWGNRT